MWRLGYLGLYPLAAPAQEAANDLLLGMRELGYVRDRDYTIHFRDGAGRAENLPERARELVAMKPDLIIAYGGVDTQAVLAETKSIPVVMIYGPDPVAMGFAQTLGRPGGNATGLSRLAPELTAKRLELLRELQPTLARVAVLWDLALGSIEHASAVGWGAVDGALRSLAASRVMLPVREAKDLVGAFEIARRSGAGAVVLGPESALISGEITRVSALAARHKMLSIAERDIYARGGILMAYGPDIHSMARRAATYIDKILRGSNPAELPIEQPTRFTLAINLNTAKALELAIPPSLRLRADEVIE
ncbi:MAG TPA: ABC transporter substrate-binding protein [Burkholderiaceae bacterium]|nr:ABC transporter substrate-binding protein [Burkholderiaceae bacterium]